MAWDDWPVFAKDAWRLGSDAVLRDKFGMTVATEGRPVTLPQVGDGEYAETYDDPVIAHGLVFAGVCYPYLD